LQFDLFDIQNGNRKLLNIEKVSTGILELVRQFCIIVISVELSNECDEYICTLPSEYIKQAEVELNETEAIRRDALEELRNWIKNNPNIKSCRMGEFP
jgi:hypothetical protein